MTQGTLTIYAFHVTTCSATTQPSWQIGWHSEDQQWYYHVATTTNLTTAEQICRDITPARQHAATRTP